MRLKFFAALLSVASAFTCHNCYVKYDHVGNLIEGQENCWSANDTLIDLSTTEVSCPENQNFCKTEVTVEWEATGEQTITFVRGCAVTEITEEIACFESTISGNRYKDCKLTCNELSNCNTDSDVLDLLGRTGEDGDPVERVCAQCSSLRDDDDSEDYCKDDGPTDLCPFYANQGCFNAHEIIQTQAGNVSEEYFKGCSFFEIKEESTGENDCSTFNLNGQMTQTCKSECDANKCNIGSIENSKVCYVCEYAFDHYGKQLSIGDPDCWDSLKQRHLQTCREGVTTCVTELDAVWGFNGKQEFALRRGCGPIEKPDDGLMKDCLTANANSQFHAKQCIDHCKNDGLACNTDLRVLEEFNYGGEAIKSCRVCESTSDDPEIEDDCSVNSTTSQLCPKYANAGCFSSRVAEDTLMGYKETTHHGCSAFRTTSNDLFCFNAEYEMPSFGNPSGEIETTNVCKETCQTPDCNINLSKPVETAHFCYVCEVTVDHLNQTVGLGDFHCLDDPPSTYEIECAETQTYCVTELEVDWMPNGDQETTVRRSCSATPAPTFCTIGNPYGSIYQRKDCASTCTNNLLSGCNNDLMEVGQKFADELTGEPIQSCFNCETHPGDEGCRLDQELGDLTVVDCPLYANAGCFTSSSRLREGDESALDIIRGCSTFSQEDNCNSEKAVIKSGNYCHVCRVVIDHNGDVIGTGSTDCLYLDSAVDYDVVDCGEESSCATHMEIAWLPFGQQEVLVERKCDVPNAIDNLCTERVTNGWLEKDCWEHCYDDMCNDNLNIAKNFAPEDGTEAVTECYTCSYESIGTNNPLDDEIGCLENPIEDSIQKCPEWAQLGCFVGDGVQKNVEGDESVNVHRGCSSFVLQEQLCGSLTIDTNVTEDVDRSRISVCKLTCTGADDCNTFRYPDWVDPPSNECPPELCGETTTQSTSTASSSSSSSTESSSTDTSSTESSSTESSTQESTTKTDGDEPEDKEADVGLILGATALAVSLTAVGGAGVYFIFKKFSKPSKTSPNHI
ncbi:Oidioi.mRNA.OKI2018_I69.PAR.g11906.t2.cds [Oikopleura dioica]|uniref:Oidioi.mRNA.OKI2018_I69.PAR.g11906.t2.cds n=1 Tax=Oikopleura dioica TaxID=34765 RepID=A0ABN7RXX4_OIKDI|nr:Oidioi.mRNA.OKI2018_I69.PAR.g11906.t2.cds [Oikopleura dioica]